VACNRLVVVGGLKPNLDTTAATNYVDDAEIYDPVSGRWYDAGTGPLFHRAYVNGVGLADGGAIFAGGITEGAVPQQSTLVWSCTPNCGFIAPQMHTPRYGAAIAETPTGVVVANGLSNGGDYSEQLSGGVWNNTLNGAGTSAAKPAYAFNAVTGDFCVAGGESPGGAIGEILCLPSGTSNWHRVDAGSFAPRWSGTLTPKADGHFWAIGGFTDAGPGARKDIDEISYAGWLGVKNMLPTARGGHTTSAVGLNSLLICGGTNGNTAALASCDSFDGASFGIGAAMNAARYGHTATSLPDGGIIVVGGSTSGGCLAETYANDQWSCLP
jgi:hypothetical protein